MPRKPSSPMRLKTESGKPVSSHSSEWGASSLLQKLWIDSRSASCSSVRQKCRLRCGEVGLDLGRGSRHVNNLRSALRA